jgi:phosphatidylethanolamine-binding protein (PEBP) family uncharacterized protein
MRGRASIAGLGPAAVALAVTAIAAAAPAAAAPAADAGKFTLTSTDLAAGGKIPESQVFNGFGCKGGNVSPALSWSGAPSGTQSFALLMHDPDAPTGSGWWHWVVYNIPATVSSLPAGAGDVQKKLMPAAAVQGRTDFGTPGYGGRARRPARGITTTTGCTRSRSPSSICPPMQPRHLSASTCACRPSATRS